MNMQMSSYMAPAWVIYSISTFFLFGFLFYVYRIGHKAHVVRDCGFFDGHNEVGHGVCMLAMALGTAPLILQIPNRLSATVLLLIGATFVVRTFTWGRKLKYAVWWSDPVHTIMILGMAVGYLPIHLWWLTLSLKAFWAWFAAYNFNEILRDIPQGKSLEIGGDVAHFAMGLVMFIMVQWPMALMVPGAPMVAMN